MNHYKNVESAGLELLQVFIRATIIRTQQMSAAVGQAQFKVDFRDIQILTLLKEMGEVTVGELRKIFGEPKVAMSKIIKNLTDQGLVEGSGAEWLDPGRKLKLAEKGALVLSAILNHHVSCAMQDCLNTVTEADLAGIKGFLAHTDERTKEYLDWLFGKPFQRILQKPPT